MPMVSTAFFPAHSVILPRLRRKKAGKIRDVRQNDRFIFAKHRENGSTCATYAEKKIDIEGEPATLVPNEKDKKASNGQKRRAQIPI
jgi:hypothetical protein